jgi:hypothetical protein
VAARKPGAETDGPSDRSPSADPRSAATGVCEDASGIETSNALDEPRDAAPNRAIRYRHRWAELLQRVFGIDALRCPRCGSTLRLIAAIEDPAVARKILECLKLPARAPPLAPAPRIDDLPEPTAPDEPASWDLDQSPRFEHFELS